MRRIDLCGLEAPEDGTEYPVVREMYGQSAAELARWVEAVRKGGQGVLKIDVPVDEAISMAVDRT
ncbi:hypothetical protein Tdes44962_MAKER07588 [Teratosphaeria destructans]|uniref:Uncharacterized protein n=1 Tax=Teratosphaeria destructans TaxID=418781 RepID=A0A9W7SZC9_9PEZI|nr:hypothetical protein Tdes44962_MAKER07588 [Teratosphaeria destructans]